MLQQSQYYKTATVIKWIDKPTLQIGRIIEPIIIEKIDFENPFSVNNTPDNFPF